jgi:pSer/pThr/pTyr-binding forkhead associated (FHA) protein
MLYPKGPYFVYLTFTGHYFPLPPQDTILIGRSDPALNYKPDIDLGREGNVASVVSRRHATLIRDGDQFLVEDLGSANKTWVDGRPVHVGMQMPIKPGQHLSLGGCILALDIIEMSKATDKADSPPF